MGLGGRGTGGRLHPPVSPPSLGGRTVGDHPLSVAGEIQISQCENPSSPAACVRISKKRRLKTRKAHPAPAPTRLPGNTKYYWGSHCELWQSRS